LQIAMPPFQDPEVYRDILNGLQIGVSVLDLQKKIAFWSDGAEQITGYARIDVLGHSCMDNILLHCSQNTCDMCTDKCPIAIALHDAKPVEAMTFIHHKSGHRTQVHTWAIPLRDKHGSIIGLIQTFEGEFALAGPDPNNRSMKERGCLDDTTGLPNQAVMQAHLREMLGTFTELQIPFAAIFLEFSAFSQFRARYGQVATRSILQVMARTLRNTVWPTDFVGRWSDDRFLVILSGCREDALPAVTQRIERMMANATIQWWGEELSVAVSIGRTCSLGGDTVEALVRRAQQGLSGNQAAATASAAATAGNPSSRS
jgi:diguanylate cyclase (GGDEF)-like protein/PAS domain S-box-containing protein